MDVPSPATGQAAALPVHSTESALGLSLNAPGTDKASSLLLLLRVGKGHLC